MRGMIVVVALSALAACGADGEPETPTRAATISLSDSGLSAQTRVGLQQGPVHMTLGLGL